MAKESGRLASSVDEADGFSVVKLSGAIDEDNNLLAITERIKKDAAVINTGNIERINSCGVRDWVHWLGELDKGGVRYMLADCSPAIIAQANLVNNFVGSGAIVSILAPYYCETCKADKLLRISVDELLENKPVRPPACRCDQCDHSLAFDDIEKYYFGFLAQAEKWEIDRSLRVRAHKLSAGEEKLRTRAGIGDSAKLSAESIAGIPSSSSTTPSNPYVYGPTMQSPVKPKGLITFSEQSSDPGEPRPAQAKTNPRVMRLIYLMIFMLALAIGMMAFALVRLT